jgi:hypothetical protein
MPYDGPGIYIGAAPEGALAGMFFNSADSDLSRMYPPLNHLLSIDKLIRYSYSCWLFY